MAEPRNAPCPCGSGKKHKQCCAREKPRQRRWVALAGIAAFLLAGAFVLARTFFDAAEEGFTAPAGKVWSAEHGHWHDAGNGHSVEADAFPNNTPDNPPEGHVWSEEHQHWHHASEQPQQAQTIQVMPNEGPPPEELLRQNPPPGKVWSEEHGHWHDVPGGEGGGTPIVVTPAAPPPQLDPPTSEVQ